MILALAILLTWSDATNPAARVGYHVERAAGACSDFSKFERLTTNPLPARQYSDSPPPGSWCYHVIAVVDGVESEPSAAITVTTKPAAPTALTAKPAAPASTPP